MKLHEDSELFATAITSAAQELGLPEIYIEKDYWVTLSLKHLSESAISGSVVFKGGTSLSKAHKVIHRFSEDIDLAAIAVGLGDAKRKSLLKKIEQAACVGLDLVSGDARVSKGSKFRKTVYKYPRMSSGGSFGQASPELLIEVNAFTHPEPFERVSIKSIVAEIFIKNDRQDLVAQYDLDSFELSVLKVERTLVEKLLGIIKDSHSTDPVARISNRIRHLYDVCMMLRKPEIRDFVESPEFKKMCEICISDEVETWSSEDTACLQKDLRLAPIFSKFDEWWPALEKVYNGIFADLVYGELPEATEVRQTLVFFYKNL